MPETWFFGLPREPLTIYRAGAVRCPHKQTQGTILAASWRTSGDRWTPWTVVDCSLRPAGLIACDMACVAQLGAASSRVVR